MRKNDLEKKSKIDGESSIEWCQYTWNPWQGCQKITEGCKFCYMYKQKIQYGQDPKKINRSTDATFYKPIKKWHEPGLVFTCSWSDFFIEEADEWRKEAWQVIKKTPHLTYQVLTKRPERILANLPEDWGDGYPNVWLGVTVENNDTLWRLDELGKIPAHVRFVSAEPLLEELDLSDRMDLLKEKFHQIIIGGESGNETGQYRYRACQIEWMEKLVQVALLTNTAPFVKQLGSSLAKQMGMKSRKGGDYDMFPETLKYREFPANTAEELINSFNW
jgi:protein gp37